MKIGELSKLTGFPVTTIRFFEEKNLITPVNRSLSGQRIYDEKSIERLLFIRAAKNSGMHLSCISRIIDYENMKITDLDDLERRIESILYECEIRKQQMQLLEEKLNGILGNIRKNKKQSGSINRIYKAFCKDNEIDTKKK